MKCLDMLVLMHRKVLLKFCALDQPNLQRRHGCLVRNEYFSLTRFAINTARLLRSMQEWLLL